MSMVAWGEISPERNCAFMVLRSGATSLWMFGRSVGEGIVRISAVTGPASGREPGQARPK
jgi:hypothetical protein